MPPKGTTDTSPALAGRAADPYWPHPCDDDRRVGRSCGLIGVIIEYSLLEMASGAVLYRKVIDSSTAAAVETSRYLVLRPLSALD